MIIYNVTISIEKEVESAWLHWMKNIHIPKVMNTKLFVDCKIRRVIAKEIGEHTFAIAYSCKCMQDYEIYQDKFSVALQTEHNQKFAGKFTAFRTILELVHSHE